MINTRRNRKQYT